MQIRDLNLTHKTYSAETWRDYDALYEGGEKFRKRVTHFLAQNPQEPAALFAERCKVAHYCSYMGPVVDYFAAFLFTSQMTIRAQVDGENVEPDEYYGKFKEACDGKRTDLADFLRARFTRALIDQCAYWLVEKPRQTAVTSKHEWRELGQGNAILKPVDREQLLDWGCDANGCMEWAVIAESDCYRKGPGQPQLDRFTWRIYDKTNVAIYQFEKLSNEPLDTSKEAVLVEQYAHGFEEIPLVALRIPVGLWVANRIESSQREHFQLSNAQGWAIRKSCYAMPVFNVDDAERPPIMGTGHYIMIGMNEKVSWLAPPTTSFDACAREVQTQRDEIYRITHQMALGVDNNAAAIGRSGESKEADANSTKVVLTAYGSSVREAVQETYQIISQGRGDEYAWTIAGLDKYDAANVTDLVDAVERSQTLNIPSPTFHKEALKRVALAMVPDSSQQTKDLIVSEIEDNFVAEAVVKPPVIEPDVEDDPGDGTKETDVEDGAEE